MTAIHDKRSQTLRVEKLNYTPGRRPILRDINFSAFKNEFIGIIGPNGAGKTTLLRLIAGLLRASQGEVMLHGREIQSLSRGEITRMVALVPQKPSMQFDFSVREVVSMGRHPHRGRFQPESERDRQMVDKALYETDLIELSGRSVTNLSGGEQQRVALARAIAQEPSILLLDEPTSNQDPLRQLRALDLVSKVVADGATAIAPLHNVDLATRYCDRIVMLRKGCIFTDGTPEKVISPETLEGLFGIRARVNPEPEGKGFNIAILGESTRRDKK